MDKIEAQNQIKLCEARISRENMLIENYKEKAGKDVDIKVKKFLAEHSKGIASYQNKLRKHVTSVIKKHLDVIKECKATIKRCQRVLNGKQEQKNCIEPINLEAEMPLINKNLLEGIKGLKLVKKGIYAFNEVEYTITSVDNSSKQLGTVVTFKALGTLDEEVKCTLYRGYYIVKYDGFNDIKHRMTAEEEKLYRKYYYNFYYRNRTKIKRAEAKEKKVQVCPTCKKEFTPSRVGWKYCSRECARIGNSENMKAKVRARREANIQQYKKVCETCGKEFIASCTTQKFCSRKCYHKAHNDRQTAKKKLNLETTIKV